MRTKKRNESQVIRDWATENHISVQKRGKLPKWVKDKFYAAHKGILKPPKNPVVKKHPYTDCNFCRYAKTEEDHRFCPVYIKNILTDHTDFFCDCAKNAPDLHPKYEAKIFGAGVDMPHSTGYSRTQNGAGSATNKEVRKMATVQTVVSSSDLTGTEGETAERRFVNPDTGQLHSVDLLVSATKKDQKSETERFDEFMAKYLAVSHPVTETRKAPAKNTEAGAIRKWAQENADQLPEGITVGQRGRIPAEAIDAYARSTSS